MMKSSTHAEVFSHFSSNPSVVSKMVSNHCLLYSLYVHSPCSSGFSFWMLVGCSFCSVHVQLFGPDKGDLRRHHSQLSSPDADLVCLGLNLNFCAYFTYLSYGFVVWITFDTLYFYDTFIPLSAFMLLFEAWQPHWQSPFIINAWKRARVYSLKVFCLRR